LATIPQDTGTGMVPVSFFAVEAPIEKMLTPDFLTETAPARSGALQAPQWSERQPHSAYLVTRGSYMTAKVV